MAGQRPHGGDSEEDWKPASSAPLPPAYIRNLQQPPSRLPRAAVPDICTRLLAALRGGQPVEPLTALGVAWSAWLWYAATGTDNSEEAARAADSRYGCRKGPCNRQWGSKSQVYRCLDCQKVPAMAMCPDCFHAGSHKNHNIKVYLGGGGSCDCGNPEMMQTAGFCPAHGPSEGPVAIVPAMQPMVDTVTACLVQALLFPTTSTPLLAWLVEATSAREVFRGVACAVMLDPDTRYLPADCLSRYLQMAVTGLYPPHTVEVLVNLLLEPQFKLRFYPIFIAGYHHVARVVAESPDRMVDGSPQSQEFVHKHAKLTSQLFAGGNLVNEAVSFESVATTLLGCLEVVLRQACTPRTAEDQPIGEPLIFQAHHRILSARLYWVITADFREYLFHDSRMGMFLQSASARRSWVKILSWLEACNPQVRLRDEHVLFDDPMWANTALLDLSVSRTILTQLHEWLLQPRGSPDHALAVGDLVRDCLAAWQDSGIRVVPDTFSAHHPLVHCISLGLAHLRRVGGLAAISGLVEAAGAEGFDQLLRGAVHVFAVKAQFRCNLWIRNGGDMHRQMFVYACNPGCSIKIDLDIHLIQLAVTFFGPDVVVGQAVEAFGVDKWLEGGTDIGAEMGHGATTSRPENENTLLGLTEDLLLFFIVVLTNRTWIDCNADVYMRNEVCTWPTTDSQYGLQHLPDCAPDYAIS